MANATTLQETGTWNAELVGELVVAASSLSEMLDNTLDISKLEEGKIEFNTVYQPIAGVVDMVMGVAKWPAKKNGVHLESAYSRIMPDLIEVDKARTTQVVMNLVGNAIKFTPADGTVKVLVRWLWNCGHPDGDCENCPAARVGKLGKMAQCAETPGVKKGGKRADKALYEAGNVVEEGKMRGAPVVCGVAETMV